MTQLNSSLSISEIRSDEYLDLQVSAYQRDLERLHARLGDFVQVVCPACGADDATARFEKYRCQFVECRSCSTPPLPEKLSPLLIEFLGA